MSYNCVQTYRISVLYNEFLDKFSLKCNNLHRIVYNALEEVPRTKGVHVGVRPHARLFSDTFLIA